MDDPLKRAEHYHEEAERFRAIAQITEGRKRDIILSIAEHFYLLHDKFVELSEPQSGELIRLRR